MHQNTRIWQIASLFLLVIAIAALWFAYSVQTYNPRFTVTSTVPTFVAQPYLAPQPTFTLPQAGVRIPVGTEIQSVVDENPAGTTYIIEAGIHRLQSIVPKDGDTFIGEPGAIMSGARIISEIAFDGTRWYADGQTEDEWVAGECMVGYEGCNNSHDLYIDSLPQRHVLSADGLEPGQWHFDYEGDRIYFAEEPSGRTIEVSVALYAFSGSASDVTIQNLTIEKYAGPGQFAALDGRDSRNWRVIGNVVQLNNGVGMVVGEGMHVLGNLVVRNGQIGVTGQGDDLLIEGNEIAYNNYSNYNPGWEGGGTKFVNTRNLVIRRNSVHHNTGPGLWTDIDNIDVVMEQNLVYSNTSVGILHEISYAAVIRDNIVKFNSPTPPSWLYGAQIMISSSRDTEVIGNEVTVASTGGNAITIVQQDRGEGAFGPRLALNNTISDNTVIFLGLLGQTGMAQTPQVNPDFYTETNNVINGNRYFVIDGTHGYWGWDDRQMTWEQFRAAGQETDGELFVETPLSAPWLPAWENAVEPQQ
jgi:hypothetical protein